MPQEGIRGELLSETSANLRTDLSCDLRGQLLGQQQRLIEHATVTGLEGCASASRRPG